MGNLWAAHKDEGKAAARSALALHAVLIAALAVAVYANTLDAPFHLDDTPTITNNGRIKDISGVGALFVRAEGRVGSRPLMLATFALNRLAGGEDPAGYRALNIALHAANGILLYFLVLISGRLLGRPEGTTRSVGLLAALLFAAHPVQTEAVTYVVSRSMLLSALFFQLGMISFALSATTGKRRYTVLLFLASLCGMASRENFVTFPLMLVLYDMFFVSRFETREVRVPRREYLAAVIPLWYLAYLVATFDYGGHAGFGIEGVSPTEYLSTQFRAHATYLRLLLLPVNQVLDYDYPLTRTLLSVPGMASLVGYAGLWVLAVALFRRGYVVGFAWLWFLVTITPDSSVVPLADLVFEHRLYLPSAGVMVVFSILLVYLAQSARLSAEAVFRTRALGLGAAVLVLCLAVAAHERNAVWGSRVALWEDTALKAGMKGRVQYNLALAYETEAADPLSALSHYERAIEINPSFADAHHNLAGVYFKLGMTRKAALHYELALAVRPDHMAHTNLGVLYASCNLLDRAIDHFEAAVRLCPEGPEKAEAHFNLGLGYLQKADTARARAAFERAASLNPTDPDARRHLDRLAALPI